MTADNWVCEESIASLQAAMSSGEATARSLCEAYLRRIRELDGGELGYHSVIETNGDTLRIADALDRERRQSGPRGPLHGIPILLKDNIDTDDRMLTTAGSLALAGSQPSRDAAVARRLREAGAVLLGKTNMSEWANFRAMQSISGWSARGGQARNAYAHDRNPSGSSSGSAVATSANLCAAAIGTETDGSIISPSNVNGIVGVKPTVGLVSRAGVIPISATQDTVGPMARTVTDAATILGAIAGPDHRDQATARAPRNMDYTRFLEPDDLQGARIGVARKTYTGYHEATDAVFEQALRDLAAAGATLIDPADIPVAADSDDDASELFLLESEFRRDLARYLGTRRPRPRHRSSGIPRNLADVIRFNESHAGQELALFGQELLQFSNSIEMTGAEYRALRRRNRERGGRKGIDAALQAHSLDALVAPAGPPAWDLGPGKLDAYLGGCTSPAAMAGYPMVSVPSGWIDGMPVGLAFIGTAWSEPTLLRLAFAYEQATQQRRPPAER